MPIKNCTLHAVFTVAYLDIVVTYGRKYFIAVAPGYFLWGLCGLSRDLCYKTFVLVTNATEL
jgi:hypothetical protein